MTSKTLIKDAWDNYEERLLKTIDASPVQVQETRRAFYAGALTVIQEIAAKVSEGVEDTPEDLAIMDNLYAEFKQFGKDIEAGRA